MKKAKSLIKVALPIAIVGGVLTLNKYQTRDDVIAPQVNYVSDPSHLTEGNLVMVDYTGERRKSVLEIGEQRLTSLLTGIEHANEYTLARNRSVPNGSGGVLVGITQHSYFVLFPNIDRREMPARFSDAWFVSQDSPGKCGSYDLVSISQYQEGKDGLVARFSPEELLGEAK